MELGKKIAQGAQHEVYQDPKDPNYVIKKRRQGNRFSSDTVKRDLDLMRRYYEPWALPTDVIEAGGNYYLRQPAVFPSTHLRPSSLSIPGVYDEFRALAEANQKARRDAGIELDLLGTRGTINTRGVLRIAAIEICRKGELELLNVLLDTRSDVHSLRLNGLLQRHRHADTSVIQSIVVEIHRHYIKKYFGVTV